jgi:hypothetical protein
MKNERREQKHQLTEKLDEISASFEYTSSAI